VVLSEIVKVMAALVVLVMVDFVVIEEMVGAVESEDAAVDGVTDAEAEAATKVMAAEQSDVVEVAAN
jgi:hypothetical protein